MNAPSIKTIVVARVEDAYCKYCSGSLIRSVHFDLNVFVGKCESCNMCTYFLVETPQKRRNKI